MSKTNPKDLATPCHWTETHPNGNTHIHTQGGLTKREHFAAMAMQGLLSNSDVVYHEKAVAENAIILADALINALNQEAK